jgi:hypothetical protein
MTGFLFGFFGLARKAAGLLMAAVTGFFKWLFADFGRVVIFGLIIIIAYGFLALSSLQKARDAQAARASNAEAKYDDMVQIYDTFVADIVARQSAAAARDAANAARKFAAQKIQNERITNDYQSRLADGRNAAVQLRQRIEQAAAARHNGNSGGAPMPSDFAAECRAFGAADCAAFFAALPDQLAAAEDNSAKLIGLQDWAVGAIHIINGPENNGPENNGPENNAPEKPLKDGNEKK